MDLFSAIAIVKKDTQGILVKLLILAQQDQMVKFVSTQAHQLATTHLQTVVAHALLDTQELTVKFYNNAQMVQIIKFVRIME